MLSNFTKICFSTFSTADVFLLCCSILQRYFSTTSSMLLYFTKIFLNYLNRILYISATSTAFYFTKIFLNYLFYVILFYKDISQPPQPPPSTPWFVMLTWFAMLGVKRFAMLGWDLLGVDFGCDVFLKFLYSNHLSLSDTDSRFAMLTQFCQKDVVCNA